MPPLPWDVAWRRAAQRHGPRATRAQVTAFHIDGTDAPMTDQEAELARLHWMAFATVPTRRLLAGLPARLHALPVSQLSRYYPQHAAKAPLSSNHHAHVDIFLDLRGVPDHAARECIDSFTAMPQTRRVRAVGWSSAGVRPCETTLLGTILDTLPDIAVIAPQPARAFHPRLLHLLLRALRGRPARVAARVPGAVLFRPSYFGTGRRAARALLADPNATFAHLWDLHGGEYVDAHDSSILHAALSSRVLSAVPQEMPEIEYNDIPVDDIDKDMPSENLPVPLDVTAILNALRMVFPFATGLRVDAALRHAALEAVPPSHSAGRALLLRRHAGPEPWR